MDASFFLDDALVVAENLIGKWLCTDFGTKTCGMIIETEAYRGAQDKASHAYGNRRTSRTEPMFGIGGTTYVYLCYGMHHLFNIVTGQVDQPHAVLIRAIKPTDGIDIVQKRRGKNPLCAGPGTLSQALGITTAHTNLPLGEKIWVEDRKIPCRTTSSARIGVDYAGEDAKLPYRFCIDISKEKTDK